MTAMSAKGPSVTTSDDAEALACRKALEFSIDAGILEQIIAGDNAHVMKIIGSSLPNRSSLGIIIEDVKCLMNGMQNVYVNSIRRKEIRLPMVLRDLLNMFRKICIGWKTPRL